MGFYAFEDLKEEEEREKWCFVGGKRVNFTENLPKNQDISEQKDGQNGASKDGFEGQNEDIFEQKGGDFVAKVDEKLLFARQLKHNICEFDFDFLGRYKLEKEEAEKLKAVLEDYISQMEPKKVG